MSEACSCWNRCDGGGCDSDGDDGDDGGNNDALVFLLTSCLLNVMWFSRMEQTLSHMQIQFHIKDKLMMQILVSQPYVRRE
jgi:hypothetical protein